MIANSLHGNINLGDQMYIFFPLHGKDHLETRPAKVTVTFLPSPVYPLIERVNLRPQVLRIDVECLLFWRLAKLIELGVEHPNDF